MRKSSLVLTLAVSILSAAIAAADGPYFASCIKIGEMTSDSAIVWARLTANANRNPSDGPAVEIQYGTDRAAARRGQYVEAVVLSDGATASQLREATPGAEGDIRVTYQAEGAAQPQSTEWLSVDGLRDFTRQVRLEGLTPATHYQVRVESRGVDGAPGATVEGAFRTAPVPAQVARVLLTVSTGQGNDDQDCAEGFKIYPAMTRLNPDFFVHTGDIIYYDKLAKTVELARYHWQRMYSWPTNVDFHRQVGSYFIKDDHDTWVNDCWPTMQTPYMHDFTFRQGQAIFLEQVPMGPSTYRTVRWGRDLQIWMVEGRDFRSPNPMADGPEKTIWGEAQKAWFKKSVQESDATFRLLISPTPIVGPDRANKNDNHANEGFTYEGDELRDFLAQQENLFVVCGDRHWQYMSIHPGTGLREYSCGPASDAHAGGWQQDDFREDYHKYLNVIGGFLSAEVDRKSDVPTLTFRYHDVEGAVKYEDVLTAK